MKVLIVGATGRTGRLLVKGALERGHDVTALARAPEKLGDLAGGVRVVAGDVLDGGAVSDAVDGQDAVLVALSATHRKSEPAVNALGHAERDPLHAALPGETPRRPVRQRDPTRAGPQPPVGVRARRQAAVPQRHAYADLRRMETSVRQSELDWTIVRVSGALTDGPPRGEYRAEPGYSLPGGRRISRADVAEYMLDQLTLREDVGHAVAVAY